MLGHFTSMISIASAAYLASQNFPHWWAFAVLGGAISLAVIGTQDEQTTRKRTD